MLKTSFKNVVNTVQEELLQADHMTRFAPNCGAKQVIISSTLKATTKSEKTGLK